jgi:hypothetical protein
VHHIRRVILPLSSYENNKIVSELVWGDPSDETTAFLASARGMGYQYGGVAVMEFLKASKCRRLIRAHQCLQHGLQPFAYAQGLTVFSSSNYMGRGNSAAFIFIGTDGEIESEFLDPIPEITDRARAVYFQVPKMPAQRGRGGSFEMLQKVARASSLTQGKRAAFMAAKGKRPEGMAMARLPVKIAQGARVAMGRT